MRISTEEALLAAQKIVQHLEQAGWKEIEISQDFYWDISAERRYDPYEQPSEMTIGQLSEDWEHVLEIANGSAEPIGYALVWLANVLRAMGETVVR